jgi:hypothetical protein
VADPLNPMSKHKKSKPKPEPTPAPADPHEVLRRPANPPQPNKLAFFAALSLFFAWFVYLVYVAVVGLAQP